MTPENQKYMQLGLIQLDRATNTCRVPSKSEDIKLSTAEIRLLLLLDYTFQPTPRLAHALAVQPTTISITLTRIANKIGTEYIQNSTGHGYRLTPPPPTPIDNK